MTTQVNTINTTLSAAQLLAKIEEVTAAERVTKAGLSVLSRELLAHAYEHGDVQLINTLMGTDDSGNFRLTPMNWRTAAMYFNNFVAFTSNYEKDVQAFATKGRGNRQALVFNKKSKAKYERLLPTVEAWLAEPTNDIWSWSDENVTMDDKQVDYLKNIANDISKAMDEEKGNHSAVEVLATIIDNTDIDLATLKAFLERPVESPAVQGEPETTQVAA